MLLAIIAAFGGLILRIIVLLSKSFGDAYFVTILLVQTLASLATAMIWEIIDRLPLKGSTKEEALVTMFAWQFLEDFIVAALFLDVEFDATFSSSFFSSRSKISLATVGGQVKYTYTLKRSFHGVKR